MANLLYIGEDMNVTWDAASVTVAGTTTYLNSATVTYSITDAAGTAVSGATGTLSYVAASSGDYEGTIESTVLTASNFTVGRTYLLDITLVQSGYNGFRRLECRAAIRGNA